MARKPALEIAAKETRDRLHAMGAVASRFKDWRPRAEVIRDVEAVPTVFCQYDDVTGVGGHPISRFTLVHGPSSEGKTKFTLGLGLSFLKRGHFFGIADAERTTTAAWCRELMGEYADHPGFTALPVKTYEQVRAAVREYCEIIANARERRELPEDATALIVVDSIRKLVPKKLWDELAKATAADEEETKPKRGKFGKKSAGGIDGFGGRAAQMKAALNAAWVDELIPLLADTRISMVVIARETEDPNVDKWTSKTWKVGGGAALYYDASLDVRAVRSWVYDTEKRVIGEKHTLEIWKTKIAGKQERVPEANFYTSNGVLVPLGFDAPRDVLELALEDVTGGIVEKSGAWFKFERKQLGQGFDQCVVKLHQDPELFARIEAAVRRAIMERRGAK